MWLAYEAIGTGVLGGILMILVAIGIAQDVAAGYRIDFSGLGISAGVIAVSGIITGAIACTYPNHFVRKYAICGMCLCVPVIIMAFVLPRLSVETYLWLYGILP